MSSEPAVIEIALPAPVATVWEAFRDPAVIRRWHGWEYGGHDGQGLDDEVRVIYVDGTLASEADRTLHIGGHLFTLDDAGDATVVRVTRVGTAEFRAEIEEGWLSFLQQLRFLLARHPDDPRRTIFLSGEPRDGGPATVAERLGLGAVAGLAPGERYSAVVGPGDTLAGEVWFRSPLQVAVTVDAWGDGLLLVARSPSAPPSGAGSVTLSTYGLDDRERAGLEESWGRWWGAEFADAAAG